jgi:hypothetical protein
MSPPWREVVEALIEALWRLSRPVQAYHDALRRSEEEWTEREHLARIRWAKAQGWVDEQDM